MLQIKEKFGTLRFYAQVPEWAYDIIAFVESDTSRYCEDCGLRHGEPMGDGPGKLTYANVRLRRGGWWRTLCDACEAKRGGDDTDE